MVFWYPAGKERPVGKVNEALHSRILPLTADMVEFNQNKLPIVKFVLLLGKSIEVVEFPINITFWTYGDYVFLR